VGLFTLEYVKRGDKLWQICKACRWFPELQLTYDMHYAEAAVVRRWGYLAYPDLWMLPCDHIRYMNHSDTPNVGGDSQFSDVALRDIVIGEELTCDYRSFDLAWREKFLCTYDKEPV
jgi:hypothetical protein